MRVTDEQVRYLLTRSHIDLTGFDTPSGVVPFGEPLRDLLDARAEVERLRAKLAEAVGLLDGPMRWTQCQCEECEDGGKCWHCRAARVVDAP